MNPTLSVLFAFLLAVSAKVVVITVGHNSTDNPSAVFDPQTVTADQGDIVYFNFTQGNHTVTQSAFAAPCLPVHAFNKSINGFDSGFRNAGNYNAITNLQVPIEDPNSTIWFFDWTTCSIGGVGGINVNESSSETYDGFTRNALRLNGTDSESEPTLSSSPRITGSTTSSSTTMGSTHSSSATQAVVLGTTGIVPLVLMAIAMMF